MVLRFLSRFRTPIYQNTGSVARDHLASERTFLSWLRTGLGFIALGIAVERFSQLDLESLIDHLKPTTPTPSASPETPPQPQGQKQRSKQQQIWDDDRRQSKNREQALVATLFGTGTGSIVYGVARYFSTMRMLEKGLFKPAYYGTASLGVAVATMAGASYWGTLRREEDRMEHRRR